MASSMSIKALHIFKSLSPDKLAHYSSTVAFRTSAFGWDTFEVLLSKVHHISYSNVQPGEEGGPEVGKPKVRKVLLAPLLIILGQVQGLTGNSDSPQRC